LRKIWHVICIIPIEFFSISSVQDLRKGECHEKDVLDCFETISFVVDYVLVHSAGYGRPGLKYGLDDPTVNSCRATDARENRVRPEL
jgi:hypothetical protein